METTIRKATEDDARAIAAVHVASWRSAYRGIVSDAVLNQLSVRRRAEHWRTQLSDVQSGDVTYVALDDAGELVGFANGGLEREQDATFSGELFAIYLLEEVQRQGIGRKLATAVLTDLYHAGHKNILVWVLESNPAGNFFEALGASSSHKRAIDIDGANHTEVAFGWLSEE